jgi:hypothetical protein
MNRHTEDYDGTARDSNVERWHVAGFIRVSTTASLSAVVRVQNGY